MTSTETQPAGPDAGSAPDAPVLEVTDLHVTFPAAGQGRDVHAVRGVSYQLRRGEILGIVGESGSGKSVSSLAAMGLLPEYAEVTGSVRLHGRELLGLDDRQLAKVRGRTISMVFQDPLSALTPVYTVGDQLAEAVRVHNPDLPKAQAAARAVELLRLVGIPNAEQRYRAFPHEFSGGMRQRVMIAMAMANDPDVIICDEPTTALDVTIQAQILEVLKTAQRETGAAIVMITHDLGVVAGFVDRVLVMYAGRPVELGTVDDVYYRTRMPYTMGLLGSVPRLDFQDKAPLVPIKGTPPSLSDLPPGCPFAPRCPLVREECTTGEPPLVRVGAETHQAACVRAAEIEANEWTAADIYPVPEIPEDAAAGTPREDREVVLEVDDLIKHHPLMKGAVFKRRVGTVYAVDGISFDIRERETLGLVGESGCGKSTTLMEILSLNAPQRGRVVVLGRESGRLGWRDRFAVRREVQVVFQDPMSSLDPRMPVFDIIAEPLRTHGHPREALRSRVHELLRLVGLEPAHATRYPAEFSGGQRQRIGIARALALEPRLLVLDEPVSALDVSIQAGVINLLDELKARLGLSYLFVAHDLSVIRHLADRVAVMYLGRIVEIGDVDAIYGAPAHPYTQALLSAIPIPDPEKERSRTHIVLEGDLPNPANPPSGCRFRTRCQKFRQLGDDERQRCLDEEPAVIPLAGAADHGAACHYAEERELL
ncbi:ABC transporter ATP-binding protein [Marinitenerispora sediminis]|uniref:Peptide ABC transporter ATP-binding protein n=1 Tax=Marinitenerispora sediminis TaxID=1931232 RepID=A0A368T7M0_9ACTN|nr:ABC transporter ATP-binding protein [Marinitenerispora sediminis]RCV57943.1 peptide ABC transporter ATP-binding protein [Marinitenerispora sediminis]RCV59693.1 peptide ABC transporter ATP-binding protein [Marinitenerispora sediminis]RCV62324.1 peptide ABC transporter ATP-binding protein [Marinitenerispora sediminis]